METVSPRDSDEVIPEGSDELSIDLIAACHLSDDVLQSATARERVEACSKLTHVRLDELQLQYLDRNTLSQLTACRSLYLQHNKLTSTAALAALPRLSFLALSDNQLQQVEGLQGLTTLLFLDVSINLIEQLNYTQLPDSIKYLKVAGNPCCSRRGFEQQLLAHFPRLKELDFGCVDDKQPMQTAAAPGAAETSDESETEDHDSSAALMGSYLLSMQQLEHLYAPNTPRMQQATATTSMQDTANIIQLISESPVAIMTQHMVGKAHSAQASGWVPDADCSKQLAARLVLSSSPQPPLQSSKASSGSFDQLCMEPSSLTSPRPRPRPGSAGVRPSSSLSLSAASLTEATAANSSAAQQLSASGSTWQHNNSGSGSRGSRPDRPIARVTRQPRVLCRPQSAQNAGYLSVKPKLGGVTSLPEEQTTASVATAKVVQQDEQQEVQKGQSRRQTKPSVVTAAQRGGTAVQPRGQTAPAAVPKRDLKAARSKAPAVSSKGASTTKATGASQGKAPVAAGNAGALPKQSGSAEQAHRTDNRGAATKCTTSSSSSTNTNNYKRDTCSKVRGSSMPSSRRTSAAAAPLSSSGAEAPSPPVDAGRPGPLSSRKLPSLNGSSNAAAKAAAIAAAAVDQPLAALLQPEPSSRPSSARRLAPVDHPALSRPAGNAANSTSEDAEVPTAARSASGGSRSGSITGTTPPTTSQAEPGANAGAAPAVPTTGGTSARAVVAEGMLALESSSNSKRSTAELVLGDARASIVLDRSQALQGCEAPLQAATQNVLAIEASSSKLQAATSSGSAVPAIAALDALAVISREALSSNVLAIRQRTKQRTQELLQQHDQELAANKQGHHQTSRQQLLQQAAPLKRLVRKPSASTAGEANEQQQSLSGPQFSGPERVTLEANKYPATCSDNQPVVPLRKAVAGTTVAQGSSDGMDQGTATPAMTALCTALNGLQGLRSRLGQDSSSAAIEYKPAGPQNVSQVASVEPLDLASRVERLKLQFAAASAQLQQAAAAAEPGLATQIASELQDDLGSDEDQPDHSLPATKQSAPLSCKAEDSMHIQPAPKTKQRGGSVDSRSGSAARHSLDDSSDMHLDTELQGVLDKVFKSSLPSYQHIDRPDSDTAGIPTALFTSKLPRMVT